MNLILFNNDLICNYLGVVQWTWNLSWSGQQAFQKAPENNWTYSGKVVGTTKSAQGFTLVKIFNAGHMMPMNQPAVSLEMVKLIISGKKFH